MTDRSPVTVTVLSPYGQGELSQRRQCSTFADLPFHEFIQLFYFQDGPELRGT